MIVAIAKFQSRISPVFDWCEHLLFLEINGYSVANRWEKDASGLKPVQRVDPLVEMGADVLICGAISSELRDRIEQKKIQVIPWVAGEIEEVVGAFLSDGLSRDQFRMAGCGRGRQRGRRGQGGGGSCTRRRKGRPSKHG